METLEFNGPSKSLSHFLFKLCTSRVSMWALSTDRWLWRTCACSAATHTTALSPRITGSLGHRQAIYLLRQSLIIEREKPEDKLFYLQTALKKESGGGQLDLPLSTSAGMRHQQIRENPHWGNYRWLVLSLTIRITFGHAFCFFPKQFWFKQTVQHY